MIHLNTIIFFWQTDSFPVESSLSLTSFINNSSETSLSCHHRSVLSVNEEVLSPSLLESVVAMNGIVKDDKYVNTTGHINSTDCFETDEVQFCYFLALYSLIWLYTLY